MKLALSMLMDWFNLICINDHHYSKTWTHSIKCFFLRLQWQKNYWKKNALSHVLWRWRQFQLNAKPCNFFCSIVNLLWEFVYILRILYNINVKPVKKNGQNRGLKHGQATKPNNMHTSQNAAHSEKKNRAVAKQWPKL